MNNLFRPRLLLGLIFLFISFQSFGESIRDLLEKRLDLSGCTNEQKEIIIEESEAYAASIDYLYKTDNEAWRQKINEMFAKLRDGFRVYNISRGNPEIQARIAGFDSLDTGIRIYLVSYVEDAFLNNLFYRLALAYYSVRKDAYVLLKYKFVKAPEWTEDNPAFVVETKAEVSPLVEAKISNALAMISQTASAGFSAGVSYQLLSQNKELNQAALQGVEGVLDYLKGTKVVLDAYTSAAVLTDYHKLLVREPSTEFLLSYMSVQVKVTWSESGTLTDHGNLNILDWVYPVIKLYKNISREEFTAQYAGKYSNWYWFMSKPYGVKAGQVQTFNVTYQKIREILSKLGDVNSFDETIHQIPPFDEHSEASEFIRNHKDRYECCLDEILRIARLRVEMGEERWTEINDPENHSVSEYLLLETVSDFQTHFKNLHYFYKSKGLITDIMACTTPGRDINQMTFLANKLSHLQINTLTPDQRVHILNVLSKGTMKEDFFGSEGEEDIANKLLETCHTNDAEEFLRKLAAASNEKGSVIWLLNDKIDDFGGSSYNKKLVANLKRLLDNSKFMEELLTRGLEGEEFNKRVVNWEIDRKINRKIAEKNLGATKFERVAFDEKTGKVSYQLFRLVKDEWWSDPEACDWVKNPLCRHVDYWWKEAGEPVSLDPFDVVFFSNYSNINVLNEVSGSSNGEISVMPAFFLVFLDKESKYYYASTYFSLAIDIASLATGPVAYLNAASRMRKAWVLFEVTSATANLTLYLPAMKQIPAYAEVVNASNALMGVLGVSQLVRAGVRTVNLGDALKSMESGSASVEAVKASIKNFIQRVNEAQQMAADLKLQHSALAQLQPFQALKNDLALKAKELWKVEWGDVGKGIKVNPDEVFEGARKSAIAKFGSEAEEIIYKKFINNSGAAAEIIDHYGLEGLRALQKVDNIQDAARELVKGKTMYRFLNEASFNFDKIKENGVIQAAPNNWPTYISLETFSSGELAKSKLQLPKTPTWVAEFSADLILNDIQFPYAKGTTASYIEVLTRSYPNLGEGGGGQFITFSEIKINRLINIETGETINY